jgi:hypothetical protein
MRAFNCTVILSTIGILLEPHHPEFPNSNSSIPAPRISASMLSLPRSSAGTAAPSWASPARCERNAHPHLHCYPLASREAPCAAAPHPESPWVQHAAGTSPEPRHRPGRTPGPTAPPVRPGRAAPVGPAAGVEPGCPGRAPVRLEGVFKLPPADSESEEPEPVRIGARAGSRPTDR